MTGPVGDVAAPRELARGQIWWATTLLFLIYAVNYVDRIMISILGEPIKNELGLTDTGIGVLSGLGFSLLYSIASFPLARYSDRGSRTRLLTICLLAWSSFTMLSGMARTATQLFFLRLGVGIGEAGCAPASHSLISDYYPPEKRAFALAIFSIGAPVGIMIGSFGGGWLASEIGWRWTFVVAGLPGILLAILSATTMREPPRGRHDGPRPAPANPNSLRAAGTAFLARRSVVFMTAGIVTTTVSSLGLTQFLAPFFIRVFGYSLTEASIVLGLLAGLAGAIGTLVGGILGDRLGPRNPRNYGFIAVAGICIAFPAYLAGLLQPSATTAIALIFLGPVGFFVGAPVTYAVAQNLLPAQMRATGAALLLVLLALVGGLGPVITGALIDHFLHANAAAAGTTCAGIATDPAACGAALAAATRTGMALTTFLLPVAACLYLMAVRYLPADSRAASGEEA